MFKDTNCPYPAVFIVRSPSHAKFKNCGISRLAPFGVCNSSSTAPRNFYTIFVETEWRLQNFDSILVTAPKLHKNQLASEADVCNHGQKIKTSLSPIRPCDISMIFTYWYKCKLAGELWQSGLWQLTLIPARIGTINLYLNVCMSVCLSVCLPVCLSACQSIYLFWQYS